MFVWQRGQVKHIFPELVTIQKHVKYNNPGLVIGLHVGLWAWPIPLDIDNDGDTDLLVSCPDVPYGGIYFFENVDKSDFPVFKPGVKIADRISNLTLFYLNGDLRLLTPGKKIILKDKADFSEFREIFPSDRLEMEYKRIRSNQWKYVDYEGEGDLDLLIGHGIWDDYGWDNTFNENGEWMNSPLYGFTYVVINNGTAFRKGRDQEILQTFGWQ